MDDLRVYWNNSSATIPEDKDPSSYAVKVATAFPSSSVVCDLGGGSGADSLYFASKGHTVRLIDISDHALVQAKDAAEKRGLVSELGTVQCNLAEGTIPLASESCDVMYSRLALHYFRPELLSSIFAEVYRVFRGGGKAFLTLKSPDDPAEMKYLTGNANQIDDGVFDEDGYIKTRFSIKQLNRILHNAGVPPEAFTVHKHTEKIDGRKDKIKSGNTQFIVNEIRIIKS
jgi:ubiquinone/menaquinone biosynthesis C-methylase UbiE